MESTLLYGLSHEETYEDALVWTLDTLASWFRDPFRATCRVVCSA